MATLKFTYCMTCRATFNAEADSECPTCAQRLLDDASDNPRNIDEINPTGVEWSELWAPDPITLGSGHIIVGWIEPSEEERQLLLLELQRLKKAENALSLRTSAHVRRQMLMLMPDADDDTGGYAKGIEHARVPLRASDDDWRFEYEEHFRAPMRLRIGSRQRRKGISSGQVSAAASVLGLIWTITHTVSTQNTQGTTSVSNVTNVTNVYLTCDSHNPTLQEANRESGSTKDLVPKPRVDLGPVKDDKKSTAEGQHPWCAEAEDHEESDAASVNVCKEPE